MISKKLKGNVVRNYYWLFLCFIGLFAIVFGGCAGIGQFSSETGEKAFRGIHQTPTESNSLSLCFRNTTLGLSTSADVLDQMTMGQDELISQSESVIAAYNQNTKRRKAWFNMAAFDEEQLTATRKYFLSSYDRPKQWFILKEKLRFDAKVIMNAAVLDEPYADRNARRIAVLERVLQQYNSDLMQLQKYNQKMANIGMLVNQTINVVLVDLKSNPAFAQRLDRLEGLDFDHPTLDEGKIRMIINDDAGTVFVKIKIGTVIRTWSQQQDVIDMAEQN